MRVNREQMLCDEEKLVLRCLREYGRPIREERFCRLVSIVAQGYIGHPFQRSGAGDGVLHHPMWDTYLGEHVIARAVDLLVDKGYAIRKDGSVAADLSIIPLELYL